MTPPIDPRPDLLNEERALKLVRGVMELVGLTQAEREWAIMDLLIGIQANALRIGRTEVGVGSPK